MIFSKEIGESLTYKFSQKAGEMKRQGKKIISLGLGEPDFTTPQYVTDATVDALNNGYTHYSMSQGLPELREHIANMFNNQYEAPYSANNVMIAPGVKHALYLALCAVLNPGDEIINISPSYVSYIPQIKIAEPQANIVDVCLEKETFSLDIQKLKKSISDKTKVILINFPHNPTGKVLSLNEVNDIVNIAVENDIYLISDEVYRDMIYGVYEKISVAKYYKDFKKIMIVDGFSKSYAMTGWRIGYAVADNDLIKKMNLINQHINTNTCTFIQKGACSIFENENQHIDEYNDKLKERADIFHNLLSDIDVFYGVKPQGGFFYFVDISKSGMNSNDFCAALIEETGIAATPGIAFGKDWDTHIRFSLAVDKEILIHAGNLLKEFIQSIKV